MANRTVTFLMAAAWAVGAASLPAQTARTLRHKVVAQKLKGKGKGASAAPKGAPKGKPKTMAIDDKMKQKIDQWIKTNNRNTYGDPMGTMYAGGTPLFSEATGKSKDRYEYILEKHPEAGK